MPGWHKQIKDLVKNGDVTMIGIIQEQHADRCRLFAQWHQFDWPILQDPINIIPTRAVPVVVAIDEHGIVRSTRPRPDWVRNEFIKTDYDEPPAIERDTSAYISPAWMKFESKDIETAHANVMWGLTNQSVNRRLPVALDKAISIYDELIAAQPNNATAHFARGVALRMRYEAAPSRGADFAAAIKSWTKAVKLDPNQYIYRRRLEQYGPRLTKPYPFYDWVAKAREDIKSRGETPHPLVVEPRGAEIASPTKKFDTVAAAENPDPNGRINREDSPSISIRSITVPTMIKAGRTGRLHLDFRPTPGNKWNNEARPAQVWINKPEGWKLQQSLFSLTQPEAATSIEPRTLDFEVKAPTDAEATTITGFALYYVCEDESGICRFARQDFEIPVEIAK